MNIRLLTAVLILVLATILGSCVGKEDIVGRKESKTAEVTAEGTKIAAILEDPSLYSGKPVTVTGKVSSGRAFQFVNEQPYRIDDGTGEIWVITSGLAPREGSTVIVIGKIAAPYQIKGRRYDIAILESERRE